MVVRSVVVLMSRWWIAASFALTVQAQTVATYATGVTGVKDVAWDASGQMYATGQGGGTGNLYTIGPNGSPVTLINNTFVDPWGMAVSPTGELYVADRGVASTANSGRIYRILPGGAKTTFVTGLSDPMFLHFDASGNLFVGEWGARTIKKVTPGGVVSTHVAALGAPGEEVGDFVIHPDGTLVVGVGPNIVVVGPSGSPVSVFASGLTTIAGMIEMPAGDFYVARYSARDIWHVTAAGVGSHWSGTGSTCVDGSLATASFHYVAGIRMRQCTMYIAASGCNRIKTVDFTSTCVPASNTAYGNGCTVSSATWYESFAAGANDVGGTALHMAPNGNGGYDMSVGTPTAFVHTVAGLALGDDQNGALALPSAFQYPGGSTAVLTICSNGFLWMQPNAGTDLSPTVAEVFGNGARLMPFWNNLRPDGATNVANVFAQVDAATNKAYVTWVNVPTFVAGGVCNMQVEFDLSTHHVNITYGTVTAPEVAIVGWTPGNGVSVVDAGSRDLSATIGGGFATASSERNALALAAAPAPVLGSTLTLTTSNIRANLSISALFFSLGQTAPVPLPVYGFDSPGCSWHLDPIQMAPIGAVMFQNPSDTVQVALPTDPALANMNVYFQSVSLAPAEVPSGFLTSNAIRSHLNTL